MNSSFKNELNHKRNIFDWISSRKTFMILILCCIIQISTKAFSQTNVLNLDLKNVSIEQVLNEIEAQTNYRFLYNKDLVDLSRKVTIVSKQQSVSKILDQVLVGTGIASSFNGKQIVLTKKVKKETSQEINKISGMVTDQRGEPIIGATVLVDGESTGTISDLNGSFHVNARSDAQLRISYIGFDSKVVAVNNKNDLKISLSENAKLLDEVVVVGFGTQKRANLTGAVSTVNAKDLESRPVANLAQALQGISPGLNISQNGGSLETRPTINIRGLATIGQGSSGNPLILIDGMEGDINTVNPNDIDNISVLKDAAASSIYGSRAPFGVILVTTKKGTAGKMQVSASANFRYSEPINLPHQMDSYTFVNYINLASRNLGGGDFFKPDQVQRVLDYQQGKLGKKTIIADPNNPNYWGDGYSFGNDNVDWIRAVYKTSTPSQDYSMNASGGTEKLNFYLSGNYTNTEGFMKLNQDTYKRYLMNAKINAKLSEWVSISYSGRFTREEYTRPAALGNSLYSNLGRQGWPTLPLYDPNGYLYSSPSPALSLRDGGRDKSQYDWNYQQLSLTLEPIKGWKIIASANYKIGDQFRHWDVLPTYNHDVNGNAYLAPQGWYINNNTDVHEEANRINYFTPNVITEYTKSLGKHNVKLMAGYQSESNQERNLGLTRLGVMVPANPIIDITSGTDNSGKIVAPSVNGMYREWSTQGVFGRINYDYDGRYLLEANLRYDGTSRFRADQRWRYFPSASAGWNVAREEFWKPLEGVVNLFKLRASYGNLGNQNTDQWFPTYLQMPFNPANSGWLINDLKQNTSSAPSLISSSLTWEQIKTYDGGVDFGLFNNRLTSTFDYYIRYTNNMIGPAPELPLTLGTGVPTTNNTDLKTTGWELSVSWQDHLKNGLGYSAKFVLSDSRTAITRYPNATGNLGNMNETDPKKFVYYEGQNVGDIWGYKTIGIAKTQAEIDAHLATLPNGGQNALGNNWKAGDIMYADLNGDGKIDNGTNTGDNHGDLTVIGSNAPRFNFGLDLSADWKGFDIRAFFQGTGKRDYFQSSPYFFGASGEGVWGAVSFVQHEDYFRDDATSPLGLNLNSYYPRPLLGNNKNIQIQSRYLQNAAYIRLKNLQVGYTIPAKITQLIKIQKCRIYVSGENIFTATKLASMFDPETIDGGDNRNGDAYPLSKVYSVGLTVNF